MNLVNHQAFAKTCNSTAVIYVSQTLNVIKFAKMQNLGYSPNFDPLNLFAIR